MTETTGFPPDPEANRAAWLAANPGAAPVSPHEAAAATDPGTRESVPSAVPTGEAMAAAGAHAGLPHEATMDAEMAALRKMVESMGADLARITAERSQERQAAISALGEPILLRYAKAVQGGLHTAAVMHPAAAEHLAHVIADSDKLVDAASDAISTGANDLGAVATLASRIDRFITRKHPREVPGLARNMDLSTVAHHLEYLIEEGARLVPGALALTGA
jgi:hypothetical protein